MMSNPAFKFDHVHIISNDPEASANWYVEMFGATITANTTARGAPPIFVDLGGMTILIRGQRPRLSGGSGSRRRSRRRRCIRLARISQQVAGHHFNRLGRVPPTPARAPHAEEGWGGGTG